LLVRLLHVQQVAAAGDEWWLLMVVPLIDCLTVG
jgi:hypothetical protein